MLLQPLLDQLTALGLNGCRAALEAQQHNSQYAELTFEDRLGLLLEAECTRRAGKRLQRRVKNARFALPATVEDVKFSPTCGLDRRRVLDLAQADLVPRHLNVFVLGPTGQARLFSLVRLARLSADKASTCATSASLACYTNCIWPRPMVPMPNSWPAWRGCRCSFSTTGCAIH